MRCKYGEHSYLFAGLPRKSSLQGTDHDVYLRAGSRIAIPSNRPMKHEDVYRILEEQYFGENMHERDEIRSLPKLLEGTRLFIDVGASLGQYTYFANRILKHSRIIAVEADPVRVARLRELAEKWGAESSNEIVVLHAALSDHEGTETFYSDGSNVSGSLVQGRTSPKASPSRPALTVQSKMLDALIAERDAGVVKIDVEGGELRVLRGAGATLASRRFRFMIEVHSWGDPGQGATPDDVFALMQKYGYRSRKLYNHHWFTYCGGPMKRLAWRIWDRISR